MTVGIGTIGALSEQIITEYYKKVKNDDANYTLRHVAEEVAQEIAYFAKASAYESEKMGESVFANDQFIVTYNALTLLKDVNETFYIPFPNIPTGLPKGREIAYIAFTGVKKYQIIMMRNKDRFMQSFIKTPSWMVLGYVENGKILLDNVPPLVTTSTATIDLKMVGSLPIGTNLVDLPLLIPKDVQSLIFDKILSRMLPVRNVLPDQINDNVSK